MFTGNSTPCSSLASNGILYMPVQMEKKKATESDDRSTSGSSVSEVDLAPDGGWGWMVCFGAFMLNFIMDGTMTSFGVILLELLDFYGETKAKTAWVGSTLFGTSMIMGPMVGSLLERYTCRQVTIAGSVISVFGFICSMFAPNIEILIITYGIIGGIGFCMMFITAIIAISLYFTRKRALATGIAMSGGGLGIFVYGYLCNFLLSIFDWKNTLLILAGILLNCMAFGALFRPIISRKNVRSSNSNGTTCSCLADECSLTGHIKYDEIIPRKEINPFRSSSRFSSRNLNESNYTLGIHSDEPYWKEFSSDVSISSVHDKATLGYLRPMLRKDIFYGGSIHTLPSFKDIHSVSSIIVSLTKDFTDSEGSSQESSNSSLSGTKHSKIRKYLHRKFKLFQDGSFVLLLISCILWTAQSIVVTYLPDMAGTRNIARGQSAMLISVVGISNTVARIVAGFVTDFLHVPSTYIYIITLLLASGANFALPWCERFEILAFCSAIFGFCMGSTIALRTIVITDHLGIDKLTQSFGIIALFQGAAFLVNPPVGGWVFDMTGTYVYPYIMVGTMYLLSGLLCLPLLRKSRNQRRNSFNVSAACPASEPLCEEKITCLVQDEVKTQPHIFDDVIVDVKGQLHKLDDVMVEVDGQQTFGDTLDDCSVIDPVNDKEKSVIIEQLKYPSG